MTKFRRSYKEKATSLEILKIFIINLDSLRCNTPILTSGALLLRSCEVFSEKKCFNTKSLQKVPSSKTLEK